VGSGCCGSGCLRHPQHFLNPIFLRTRALLINCHDWLPVSNQDLPTSLLSPDTKYTPGLRKPKRQSLLDQHSLALDLNAHTSASRTPDFVVMGRLVTVAASSLRQWALDFEVLSYSLDESEILTDAC
jgi:hypothetical protein